MNIQKSFQNMMMAAQKKAQDEAEQAWEELSVFLNSNVIEGYSFWFIE